MRARTRFPRGVFSGGHEPDPRFTLADERTFPVWIRTSLAMTASGVALAALAVPVQPTPKLCAAAVLLAASCLVPLLAWRRTTLSLMVAGCVALLPLSRGPWSTSIGPAGLTSAALLRAASGRRRHRVGTALLRDATLPDATLPDATLPDAKLLLALTLLTGLVGLVGLVGLISAGAGARP